MPEYITKNGAVLSEAQVAEDMALVEFTDLQSYLDFAGLKVKGNGVAETDASVAPGNNQASDGDSNSENSLLGSPDDYFVTIEDLQYPLKIRS